jgi:hypothetical protein
MTRTAVIERKEDVEVAVNAARRFGMDTDLQPGIA